MKRFSLQNRRRVYDETPDVRDTAAGGGGGTALHGRRVDANTQPSVVLALPFSTRVGAAGVATGGSRTVARWIRLGLPGARRRLAVEDERNQP